MLNFNILNFCIMVWNWRKASTTTTKEPNPPVHCQGFASCIHVCISEISIVCLSQPEGVERMRSITFPVMLSADMTNFDQNVALDFLPWTIDDVVQDSRRAAVKITGKFGCLWIGRVFFLHIDRHAVLSSGCQKWLSCRHSPDWSLPPRWPCG